MRLKIKKAAEKFLQSLPSRPVEGDEPIRFYKVEYRDFESILHNKDEDKKPFIASITMSDGKLRILPVAKVGEKQIIIERPEEFDQRTMSWCEHQEVAPLVAQERLSKLSLLLKDGYRHFFDRFYQLIDEGSSW